MTGEIRERGRPRGRLKRHHPPNCTVCDLGPSRFLAFRAKQREVEAKYGFRLGVHCRTPEQREGRRRYMSDWQRCYRETHREKIVALRAAWEERRREARRAERETRRAERQAAKDASLAAWEEKRRAVRERYGFDLGMVPLEMSPEEAEARMRYARDRKREYRETHREELRAKGKAYRERAKRKAELRLISLANLAKARARQAELRLQREAEAKEERRRAFEAKREAVRAKYGFTLGERHATPEEAEGRRRYRRDSAREYYEAQRERDRVKAERRRRLRELNEARHKASVEERRRAKAARRAEKRRRREEAKAALEQEVRNARAAFDAEREANRAAYLAAKAERGERGEQAAMPRSPSSVIPPVEPPGGNIGTGGGDDDWERRMREEAEQAERIAREAEREALREAKAAERLAAKQAKREAREAEAAERKALLKQAYATFAYKVTAYRRNLENARRSMGLPTKKRKWTPEQRRQWSIYLRESRRELDDWLVERMRRELDKAARAERREHRRLVSEGKAEPSAEQLARQKRRHDKQMAYNREYRRRKRAEALAEAQAKWTPAQWAEWEKRQAAKNRHTPAWLVGEVVKLLAAESGVSADDVAARLIECGGIDFLMAGAESMGRSRLARRGAVAAAARALMFHIDPDHASMFEGRTKD